MPCKDQLNFQKYQNIFRFKFNMKFVSIVEFSRVFTTAGFWKHKQRWSLQQILLKSFVFNDPTASFSPGSGTELKFLVSVARRLSRWPCSVMFVLRCCTASTSSFSMTCFMLSMCLLKMAFCYSSSVGFFAKLSQFAFTSYDKMRGIYHITADVFTCFCFIMKGENSIIV